MKGYFIKFTQLVKFPPALLLDSRAHMSKFVTGLSDLVVKECRTFMLIRDKDISHLMTHAQEIETEKLKKRDRENKRAKIDHFKYSQ